MVLPGDNPEQTARDLLSLAESTHDVRTSSDDGLAFLVRPYLAELYDGITAEVMPVDMPAETAVPKKRGRARKEP